MEERRVRFLEEWREKKWAKWIKMHSECCAKEEHMEELERQRGSWPGTRMGRRRTQFIALSKE